MDIKGDGVHIRVKSSTVPSALAGSIMLQLEEQEHRIYLSAVGAGAVNQAVKAVAIADGFAKNRGYRLALVPKFTKDMVGEEVRTAMSFLLLPFQEEGSA